MHLTLTYPVQSSGRFFTRSNVRGYCFGFNGKEKVDEVYGDANAYDFGARLYDPRLGRWLAVDPLAVKYSFVSPYQFVNNSPLIFIDPNGKEWINVYDADVERINNELSKNPNDKKLQRDLVRAIDNQATVNKIINDIKTNDVALFNYIDNLQVSDAYTGELKNIKVRVSIGDIRDRQQGESAFTHYKNFDRKTKKERYIRYNALDGSVGAPTPTNSKNEDGFDITIFEIGEWSDVSLANEIGDVMFRMEYPQDAYEDGSDSNKLDDAGKLDWSEYMKEGSAGHYSTQVEKMYKARKKSGDGKDPNNNPYPLKK